MNSYQTYLGLGRTFCKILDNPAGQYSYRAFKNCASVWRRRENGIREPSLTMEHTTPVPLLSTNVRPFEQVTRDNHTRDHHARDLTLIEPLKNEQNNSEYDQTKVFHEETNTQTETTLVKKPKSSTMLPSSPTLFDSEFGAVEADIPSDNVKSLRPGLQPAFNYANYVNDSPILQKLVDLGVNLSWLEKGDIPDKIMAMNFERDVRPILVHMKDIGIQDKIGYIISMNPYILIYGLSSLKEITDYLKRKKFSQTQIAHIVSNSPQFISRSVKALDGRLGFFQKTYGLTGDQLRDIVTRRSKLLNAKLSLMQKINFKMIHEMGFKENELREIFIVQPKVFVEDFREFEKRFLFIHKTMKIPHQAMVKFPDILAAPLHTLKRRHKFLETLDRACYDPLGDGYTSLTAFTNYDERDFCQKIAGVDFEIYKKWRKTQ